MFHPRDHDDNIEFDAALAFIDSFETLESCSSERAEGLSSSDSDLEEHKSPCSSVSASNDHPAQVSTTLRNARELKSNPNRARDERRRELRALRAEAAELQTKLETLREVRRDIAQRNLPPSRTARGPCWELARRIWLGTAQRQFNQRMAAVQENKRLTDLVKANDDIISKLQSTLRQWSPDTTMLALDPEVEHCLQSYDFDALFNVNVDQLMANTDSSYQQIDQVFNQSTVDLASISSCSTPQMRSDAAGNLFSQVFGSRIFPFAAQETSRVVWDVVSDCVRPSSRCLFNHVRPASILHMQDWCRLTIFSSHSRYCTLLIMS
ncbi:unnamed protein product [Phytophthora lilii]|uniref:Unnamed protein product n=1 Tax=Phytophthora lilii TaxID=2077276 RepID=A0A9W6YK15_9STRA|nr:unnamed protein product [Phytophthora lilii]